MSVSEESVIVLFEGLLAHSMPTVGSIRALRIMALKHLRYASTIYNILLQRLMTLGPDGGSKTQAAWYFLDGLLKDVPHVFVPLSSQQIQSLVEQYLPAVEPWSITMVRTWDSVFPSTLATDIIKGVIKAAAVRQLHNIVAADAEEGAEATFASPHEISELKELWSQLEKGMERHRPRHQVEVQVKREVKREPGLEGPGKGYRVENALTNRGNTKADEIDMDVDYEPDYIAGARMQQLEVIHILEDDSSLNKKKTSENESQRPQHDSKVSEQTPNTVPIGRTKRVRPK